MKDEANLLKFYCGEVKSSFEETFKRIFKKFEKERYGKKIQTERKNRIRCIIDKFFSSFQ